MKRDEKTTLFVDWEHILNYSTTNHQEGVDRTLADDIMTNYYRFDPFLRKALFNCVFRLDQGFVKNKVFFVAFYNLPSCYKLRDMRTNNIGRLNSIYGTVTRTTEV